WWKFDEGNGITAYDSSNNADNGLLANGATWVPGMNSPALSFNGMAAEVVMNLVPPLDNLPQITVAAWVYPTGLPVATMGAPRIVSKEPFLSAPPVGRWIFALSDAPVGGLQFLKGYSLQNMQLSTGGTTVMLNTWQHVAVTWDGTASSSGVHFYV